MATMPHDSNSDRAVALREWLERFQFPPRVINPLRRDLEVVIGERADTFGKAGVLAGFDQAQFIAELYKEDGGLIRRIPTVGALVIEALREVIPPRRVRSTKPAPVTPLQPGPDEGWRDFELEETVPSAALPAEVPSSTPSPLETLPLLEPPPRDQPDAPPRRGRGRPRRVDQAIQVRVEEVAPKRPRGRPRRVPVEATPLAPPPPPTPDPVELSESDIRRLWHQLHPQGRRAVLSYMAEQLVVV